MRKFGKPQRASVARKLAALFAYFAFFLLVVIGAPYAAPYRSSEHCVPPQSGSSAAALSAAAADAADEPAWQARNRLAIVYLTKKADSSMANLEKSLQLVHQHVLPWTTADVLVFHEGAPRRRPGLISGSGHPTTHRMSELCACQGVQATSRRRTRPS